MKKEGGTEKFSRVMSDSITSVDFAGNIVVIKTYPGMAGAVAACVDSYSLPEIVGSLAGDDAVFIVVRDVTNAASICEKFKQMILHS